MLPHGLTLTDLVIYLVNGSPSLNCSDKGQLTTDSTGAGKHHAGAGRSVARMIQGRIIGGLGVRTRLIWEWFKTGRGKSSVAVAHTEIICPILSPIHA